MKEITTVQELKDFSLSKGSYFFTPGSMGFFRSKVHGVFPGGVFITSEQYDSSAPRLFTVRKILEDGSTEYVSKFQEFSSLPEAKKSI